MSKNEKVKLDDFVQAIRPDPKDLNPLVVMEGYLGKSSEKESVRLYSDASLNQFVDIPESAIVHSLQNSKEQNALGGCKLWIKQDADVAPGNAYAESKPKSNFLSGQLMSNYQNAIVNNTGLNTQNLPIANPSYVDACPSLFNPFGCGNGCRIGTITCFGGTINCLGGTRTCFRGTIDCFAGTIDCLIGTGGGCGLNYSTMIPTGNQTIFENPNKLVNTGGFTKFNPLM